MEVFKMKYFDVYKNGIELYKRYGDFEDKTVTVNPLLDIYGRIKEAVVKMQDVEDDEVAFLIFESGHNFFDPEDSKKFNGQNTFRIRHLQMKNSKNTIFRISMYSEDLNTFLHFVGKLYQLAKDFDLIIQDEGVKLGLFTKSAKGKHLCLTTDMDLVSFEIQVTAVKGSGHKDICYYHVADEGGLAEVVAKYMILNQIDSASYILRAYLKDTEMPDENTIYVDSKTTYDAVKKPMNLILSIPQELELDAKFTGKIHTMIDKIYASYMK